MRELHEFHLPLRYVVGTVGEGSSRDFFIQAKSSNRLVTISLDETQADILNQSVNRILDELIKLGIEVPVFEPGDLDLEPLDLPFDVEFSAGAIGLAWNETTELLTIEIHAESDSEHIPDVEENVLEGPPCLRVRLTAQDGRNFVSRTARFLRDGRQSCQFCQLSIESSGHICPRSNGYLRS
ncbi:MAG: hypothetical protein RLZZ330_922 [Actinomycetota bacterium]|jgi:uncharacterized repeat protein (TIGR03847 family)